MTWPFYVLGAVLILVGATTWLVIRYVRHDQSPKSTVFFESSLDSQSSVMMDSETMGEFRAAVKKQPKTEGGE